MLRFVARATLVLLVVAGLGAAAGYVWFEQNILSTLPTDLSEYRTWRPLTTVSVHAADGTVVDEFYVEKRVWVDLDELPDHVWKAFIAAEDRRFFEHPGVDVFGILRAMRANFEAGETTQGASTLTQQLVKNLIVGKERSYTRKLREAVLAYRLEQELGKEGVLELYLNLVALGSGNYGVEAASRDYFGLSARDIDPGQAALLAGLVPAPSRYSPRSDPETAKSRRRLVLRAMVEEGYLDEVDVLDYLEEPVIVPRVEAPRIDASTAYVTEVRREVRRLFGDAEPFARGLQVYTPLDEDFQATVQAAVREALSGHAARQGQIGPLRHVSDRAAFLRRAPGLERADDGSAKPPEPGQCFDAVVLDDRDLLALLAGPYVFALDEADRTALVAGLDGAPPRPLHQAVRSNDLLKVCAKDDDVVTLPDRPWSEGSAVVIENATGRVLAVVGGWQVGLEGFIRATQARRQPGSSFKPYVYSAALLHGRTQIDLETDGPLSLPGASGAWSPQNYGGGFAGPLPLRYALRASLNTVSVRLILDVGPSEVARLARAMGVRTPIRLDPTIALGSSEVTPMDQALGYATIARGGVHTDPVWIDRIESADGRLTALAGDSFDLDGAAVTLPGGPGDRALDPAVAYEMADMLREVVRGGTARKAYLPDRDRAGKTGTTNDFVDAWFVGFTPAHTIAVWVGTDGTGTLGDKETGGKCALPAWMAIVEALGETPGERLPVPPEAMLVKWEGSWIGLARGNVPASALPVTAPRPGDPLPAFQP